jgi:hypothetical protein
MTPARGEQLEEHLMKKILATILFGLLAVGVFGGLRF